MDAFKAVSPLRAVDMIVEVNQAIAERGLNRVGILGTQTVMETRFYGGVTSAEIIAPGGQELLDVHQAYVTMAASGVITEAQRSVFDAASHRLLKKGAQAILLGGTDLVLVYDERTSSFPLIDCASIHADAIARLAIG